jgi:hypothetical protein
LPARLNDTTLLRNVQEPVARYVRVPFAFVETNLDIFKVVPAFSIRFDHVNGFAGTVGAATVVEVATGSADLFGNKRGVLEALETPGLSAITHRANTDTKNDLLIPTTIDYQTTLLGFSTF